MITAVNPIRLFVVSCAIFLLCLLTSLWTQQWLFILFPFACILLALFLYDIRIVFLCMLASIPFSVNLQERLGIGLDFPDEGLMLLLTLFSLPFFAWNSSWIDWKQWLKNPLVRILLFGFVWMTVSVFFSMDIAFSMKYLVKRIWYLLPFFVLPILLFQSNALIRKSFFAMFFPLLFIVILVLIRYRAVGFRFEEVHDPIQPFFINHVMYGSMLSCFAPLVAGAICIHKKWTIPRLLLLVSFFVFLLGIYFSYSRAAWMAILFAAGTVVFVRYRIMHYAMLGFYAVILMAVLWLSHQNHYLNFRPKFERTIMHESLEDHIMATLQGTDISSAERYYRWIAAIRMSVDHPITGVGPNNFYNYYKPYTIAAYRTWVSRNLEKSTTHNYFLFMLVEQGYPALLLYALLMVAIFWYAQKVVHQSTNSFHKVCIYSVTGMLGALFINNFFSELIETDKIGSLFLLGIALLVGLDLQERQHKKYPTEGSKS